MGETTNSCDNENCQCNQIEEDNYVEDAHKETDKIINKSLVNLHEESLTTPNIAWPNIGEFNIDVGKVKIEEYVKTWEIGCNWLHCIDFLCKDALPYCDRYRYKVQWSVPTRKRPIPRATANVYFAIDVSTVKPKDTPCHVQYTFETNKLIHIPGKSRFREKWLKDIIESKILLMDTVTF